MRRKRNYSYRGYSFPTRKLRNKFKRVFNKNYNEMGTFGHTKLNW